MLYTLDFETFYSKEYSLSKLTTEAYVRSPLFEAIGVAVKQKGKPGKWLSGTHQEIKQFLDSFELHKHAVVCHNTMFDAAILNWHFDIRPRMLFDTLSMARPLHERSVSGCSLAALAKHYRLGEKGVEVVHALGKRRADFTEEEMVRYGGYCLNDCALTESLHNELVRHYDTSELFIIDMVLRMFTEPVLLLDKALLEDHLKGVLARKEKFLESVVGSAGLDQLMSNDKFAEVLRSLGVEPPTKISARTNKLTYAFSKKDLDFLALQDHEDERVQAVMAARLGVKSTQEETRTKAFIGISERGAFPIPLNYGRAHTGRLSGGDGVNPQNLKRGGQLRYSILAPEGHLIVAGDSSQIEARKTALLAGQWDLVDDFRQKKDIYSLFASGVYGHPVNKKDHPTERFVGKTCILGLGFGTGAAKLQHSLATDAHSPVEMPLERCEEIVQFYRRKYRRIRNLWYAADKVLEGILNGVPGTFGVGIELRYDGEGIYLPNGQMIRYPGLQKGEDDQYFYFNRKKKVYIYNAKLIENVVQALARIVVFTQMLEMRLRYGYKVALTVHDEIVLCVRMEEAAEAMHRLEQVMSFPPAWCSNLPVACEVGSGQRYGNVK